MTPDRIYLALATLCFAASFGYAVASLRAGSHRGSWWNFAAMLAGLAFQTAFLGVRGAVHGRCPVTDLGEKLVFVSWSMVIIYVLVGRTYRLSLMGVFTAPLVFLCSLFALVMPFDAQAAAAEAAARGGTDWWTEFHIGVSLLAYGAFGMAFVAGLMYLIQERQVRRGNLKTLFYNLPPMQNLAIAVLRAAAGRRGLDGGGDRVGAQDRRWCRRPPDLAALRDLGGLRGPGRNQTGAGARAGIAGEGGDGRIRPAAVEPVDHLRLRMNDVNDSELLCLGLSHENAPVALRERLAVSEKELPVHCEAVSSLPGFDGAVVLSTCNRMEVYATSEVGGGNLLAAHLAEVHGFREGEDLPYYRHRGEAAARHLFGVASGLDSMVLGETEIFGQVKKAYAVAHGAGHTGKALNKLFQQAFQIAKYVRTNSQITRGATSVGAAGVDLAEKIFGDLSRCTVMVLGAGKWGNRSPGRWPRAGSTA